jgi:hypothetical protein
LPRSGFVQQEEQQLSESVPTVQEIPENTIAIVNETYITKTDLDHTIRQTLGVSANKISNTEKQKILNSLIQSRVFAIIQEKKLSKSDQENLDSKVRICREKLLVQQFLQQRLPKNENHYKELQKYYDDHPFLFGAGYVYHYEKIITKRRVRKEEHYGLKQQLLNPEKHENWKEWVAEIQKQGYPINYMKKSLSHFSLTESKRIKLIIKRLSVDECSPLILESDLFCIVRLLKKEISPPEPYYKVKNKVKNAYNRTRMSEEIQKAFEELKAQADIEIF